MTTFDDVDPAKFYAAAVAWMAGNGITTGTSPTTFSPDDPVTRGEVATFLHRYEMMLNKSLTPAFAEIVERLDALEGNAPTDPVDPDPPVPPVDPPVNPPTGDVPWTIPTVNGTQPDVAVALPEGPLGPRYNSIIPATELGLALNDKNQWEIDRDLEDLGGTIDFGAHGIRLDGHIIEDFVMSVPDGMKFLIQGNGGALRYFRVDADDVSAASIFEGKLAAANGSVLGWSGDLARLGAGDNCSFSDFHARAFLPPEPQFDAQGIHADGFQMHAGDGGPGGGRCLLRRVVIDWNNCGSRRNTTAVIFTQHSGGVDGRDILVLNPGGTAEPVELHGTANMPGIGGVQFIGVQVRNERHGFMGPKALVRTSTPGKVGEIFDDVPGADPLVVV